MRLRSVVLGGLVALLLSGAVYLRAQSVSSGGAFLPLEDITVSGVWTFRGASPIKFEGGAASADDGFELTLAVPNVTADTTITIPLMASTNGALLFSTLTTNDVDVANSVWATSNNLVFEGATANTFETLLTPVDPTADTTVSIPNAAVAVAMMISTLTTNNIDAANSIWAVSNGLVFEGATADGSEATINFVDPAADGTLNFTLAGQVAGEQLQTDGSGVLTWEAAGSSRAMKTLVGQMTPAEGLAAILATPVYQFYYRPDGPVTTGDFRTRYVGVLAEEAPWAMHHNGQILNPVNTFGYTVLAVQALEEELAAVKRTLAEQRDAR